MSSSAWPSRTFWCTVWFICVGPQAALVFLFCYSYGDLPTSYHQMSSPVSDPETAVEISRSYPFSNVNLGHLTMTNIIVPGLVRLPIYVVENAVILIYILSWGPSKSGCPGHTFTISVLGPQSVKMTDFSVLGGVFRACSSAAAHWNSFWCVDWACVLLFLWGLGGTQDYTHFAACWQQESRPEWHLWLDLFERVSWVLNPTRVMTQEFMPTLPTCQFQQWYEDAGAWSTALAAFILLFFKYFWTPQFGDLAYLNNIYS